jgi:chromosome segregation ATPase
VRTARITTAAPAAPQLITLPATPPNTLPSHNVPDAANPTQPKLSNESDFEVFNFAERMEDFESSLLDYGRSIMSSAVNDDCDSQTLENDMITTKEKVIAQYSIICQHLEELSHSLNVKGEEASNLKNEIAELQRAKAAMEEEKSDVIQAMDVDYAMKKKEAQDLYEEKEKYQNLFVEAENGKREAEAELAGLKQGTRGRGRGWRRCGRMWKGR